MLSRKERAARWLLALAAAAVVILSLRLILSRRQIYFGQLSPQDGVVDASNADFSNEVFTIVNSWQYYPGAFYTSEDFAAGGVTSDPDGNKQFGTYRLIVRAQPDIYLAICGFSVDYATRIFVDGTEAASFGTVADDAGEISPKVGYMTVPFFTGDDGETEIIYHFSNFVHRDPSFVQTTYISTPQNIENYKSGNDLVSLCLSGAMLGFCFYFLLNAAVRGRVDSACMAFCCLLIALRDQNFFSVHLMPPGLSWRVEYRVLMLVVTWLPASFLLLLKSMYPWPAGRRVTLVYMLGMALAGLLIWLLPTRDLVAAASASYLLSIPYLVCLLSGIVGYYRRQRSFGVIDALTAAGFSVLLLTILSEALMSDSSSSVAHYGLAPFGMLIFVLIISVTIGLRMQKKEAELAESRRKGELLEQMNEMHIDFLRNVAHELKTPLTVISGYAQLTGMQLAAGSVDCDTGENLKTIQSEAIRLARMVTNLTDYSRGRELGTDFADVCTCELLDNVKSVCTPMCAKNNNTLSVDAAGDFLLYGNYELLLQVFINLVVNANRHTANGRIEITSAVVEDRVCFRVSDSGSGISEDYLPHLFEKGYSPDGGSGLGLYICREAAESHGGTIDLEKTGPEGTVFRLELPKGGSKK